MKPDKKKDALTDVAEIATKPQATSDTNVGEGQAVASSGDVVTLGIDADIQKDIDALAERIVRESKGGNKGR